MPWASSRARTLGHVGLLAGAFRGGGLQVLDARSGRRRRMAGGRAVVKMKPEAKLRTKSISSRRGGDVAADDAEGLAERALDQRRSGGQGRVPRRRRRRGGRTGRRRGPRRGRSWRRGPRQTSTISRDRARCRRPSSRRSRRRRSSGGRRRRASLRSRSRRVVVLPQHLVGAGVADAFDHAGVVLRVRQDHRVGDL